MKKHSFELNSILSGLIKETLKPIADQKGVSIVFEKSEPLLNTTGALDDILSSVFSFLLRLICILPEGDLIRVRTKTYFNEEESEKLHRIEVITLAMYINPNLIWKPSYIIFKIEQKENNSVTYLEWPALQDSQSTHQINQKYSDSKLLFVFKNNDKVLNNNWAGIEKQMLEISKDPFISKTMLNTPDKKQGEFLDHLMQFLLQHLSDPELNPDQLAKGLGFSRAQLHRKIKEVTGYSTSNYVRHLRIQIAQNMLKKTNLSIAEIAYQCGFNEPSYFSSSFQKDLGMSPKEYRELQ
ncbi:MAG: helix-turn-helix transcriptional regulator [Saprospiraceae bacterium]|nr:helix-turn-helix transcriptional regulator [Saprospiraceae bacterium]MBK7810808.1 helix-turn-helix transcriptional regulator [Saprospiraceae bacterium]MBK9630403.1 helix-turn-helix transcriptional regulator [Saprospiraceae bacterium]